MADHLFDLTGFQRDTLLVIAGLDQPSGQDVKEELQKQLNDINHGRLYPNLDALVEEGYVEKGQIDRRTNYYDLTGDGNRRSRIGANGRTGKFQNSLNKAVMFFGTCVGMAELILDASRGSLSSIDSPCTVYLSGFTGGARLATSIPRNAPAT